jgi:membrane protein
MSCMKWKFLSDLFDHFISLETPRLAAALAFYLVVSFAPLIILFMVISSVLNPHLIESFATQIALLTGSGGEDFFNTIVAHAKSESEWTSLAGIIGFVTLLVSSSVIFGELRADLNKIFNVKVPAGDFGFLSMSKAFLKERLSHVGMVLSFILLLIVSLIASSVIFTSVAIESKKLATLANLGASWIFFSCAFVLMIRFIPDKRQDWKSSIRGGVLISSLFLLGKEMIGLYIGESAIGSSYGGAASAIVFLIWIYYSAMIIFVGAEAIALGIRNKETTNT